MTDRSWFARLVTVVLIVAGAWACAVWFSYRSTPPGLSGAEVTGGSAGAYSLKPHEVVRYIPAPDPSARQHLFDTFNREVPSHLVSVTVSIAGTERTLRSMQVGDSFFPRTLYHVLTDSLRIPMHQLENLGLAHRVALRGDWVVRADAPTAAGLDALAGIVRSTGRHSFRIVEETRDVVVHRMSGAARSPAEPLALLPPVADLPAPPPQRGNYAAWVRALSDAIGHDIEDESTAESSAVFQWHDHARGYRQLQRVITADMIQQTLDDVSRRTGVAFEETVAARQVFRLAEHQRAAR